MKIFKPADPSKRRPAWLQNRTKENFLWQIAMAGLLVAGLEIKYRYDERKLRQKVEVIDVPHEN